MGELGGGQGDNLPATVQVATIRLSRLPVLSISSYSLRCQRVPPPHFGPVGCWNHSVGRRYSRFFGCFIANQIGLLFCFFFAGGRDCYCAVAAILEVQQADELNFCYTFAPTPEWGVGLGGRGLGWVKLCWVSHLFVCSVNRRNTAWTRFGLWRNQHVHIVPACACVVEVDWASTVATAS